MRRIFTRRPDREIVARRDFSDLTYLLEIRHPMLARASRPGHGRRAQGGALGLRGQHRALVRPLGGGEKAGKRPEARARRAELVRTTLLSPLGFLAI